MYHLLLYHYHTTKNPIVTLCPPEYRERIDLVAGHFLSCGVGTEPLFNFQSLGSVTQLPRCDICQVLLQLRKDAAGYLSQAWTAVSVNHRRHPVVTRISAYSNRGYPWRLVHLHPFFFKLQELPRHMCPL